VKSSGAGPSQFVNIGPVPLSLHPLCMLELHGMVDRNRTMPHRMRALGSAFQSAIPILLER
jgi:DNA primase large subunit